ncbi:MAG TPA: hypothetical protein VFV67_23325 [Actinophytocola sp.]|uniref:hypothetical protein n=1 Tax=Actinophytocola sp. TaxID=1872138 RepID=UPI002DB8F6A6|nr:hypothetical protein [Actinophytocola sp.]HEU5473589.1 hypothetical protein [Actinophytocola sp.]
MAVAELSIRPDWVLDTDICPVLPEGVTDSVELPPGWVLIARVPTIPIVRPPRINRTDREFTITMEDLDTHRWDWKALRAPSTKHVAADLHCAAGWSGVRRGADHRPLRAEPLLRRLQHATAAMVTGQFTQPRAIADLVVFLASDRAGNLTGRRRHHRRRLITTT